MVEILGQSEVELKDTSKGFQEKITDFGTILDEQLEAEGIDPNVNRPLRPMYDLEMLKQQDKARETQIANKLDIVSSYVGQPVSNADFNFFNDFGLAFTMSRMNSFEMRKKRFLSAYPEGQFIRQNVTIGDDTYDLEMYKKNKDDKEFKLVNPFGLEYSDIPQAMGTLLNFETVLGTAGAFVTRNPTIGTAAGAFIGRKIDKGINALLGYGEDEFYGGFDATEFFKQWDDYGVAALTGGLYKLTSFVGDRLIRGKRPGTIEISESLVDMADELDLDRLVFAQLAVNPQIRNMFTQSEGFISLAPDIRRTQTDSIIRSLEKGTLFKNLKLVNKDGDAVGPSITIEDLINVQNKLALDFKKQLKVNFNIKDGVTMNQADEALASTIKNFNEINNKFTNRFLNNAAKSATDTLDGGVNVMGFQKLLRRELNKLTAGIGKQGMDYKGPKDFPQLTRMYDKIRKLQGGFNAVNNPNFKNQLNTLFEIRKDLFRMMHDPKATSDEIFSYGQLHKHITRYLDPKNGFITGSKQFTGNMKLLNTQALQYEVMNGMKLIRDGLIKGNDLSGFASTFIKPGNYTNIKAIKELMKLPDDATAADRAVNEKFFNTIKNHWITSTIKNPRGQKILSEFMVDDPESLRLLLGPDYATKVKEIQKLIQLNNKVENGIFAQALTNKGNSAEFMTKLIDDANAGKFGAYDNITELIKDSGGINSPLMIDVRNNILKDIFKRSLKIEDKTGKKLFQEVLDVKEFANNIMALRNNKNLSQFFTDEQFAALKAYEQYSRAVGGNLGVGGELAKAEQTSKLVQNFAVIDTGLTILKYRIISQLLSGKVGPGILKNLSPDGLDTNSIRLFNAALLATEKELLELGTGYDSLQDQNVIGTQVMENDEVSQMRNNQPVNVAPVNFNVNDASRLASVNPAGMLGTPTTTTGTVDQNLLARGRDVFPNSITFAAKGGIMNTKKAFQRVI